LIPAELTIDAIDGFLPHDVSYPAGSTVTLIGEAMSVYDGKIIIPFVVTVAADVAPGEYRIGLKFEAQPCNDILCRPPETIQATLKLVVGQTGEPINSAIFAVASGPSETSDQSGSEAVEDPSDLQRLIDEYGIWGYFLALGLAFVTGLLLSFSPCTYPMIPITVSIFAGQERSVGRGFVLSLFYVGSMAVVYGLMGLMVSLVGGCRCPSVRSWAHGRRAEESVELSF
jgi:thiol:disulfide interchange protein DsbD